MDAMSDAIEGADVMLYGVSLAYKESAVSAGGKLGYARLCVSSTRLTCPLRTGQLRTPTRVDMIPLMMQQDYQPKGWRVS